jgi:hypothetical protein
VLAHINRGNPSSIYRTTLRVLERAEQRNESPARAANDLADEAITQPHPIHGSRAQRIVQSLLAPTREVV